MATHEKSKQPVLDTVRFFCWAWTPSYNIIYRRCFWNIVISPLAGLSKTDGRNLGKLLLLALVPLFCQDPVARAPPAGAFSGVAAGGLGICIHSPLGSQQAHTQDDQLRLAVLSAERSRMWWRSQSYFGGERSQSFHCVTFSSVGQIDRQRTYVFFFLIPCWSEHTPFSFTLLASGGRDM